MPSPQPPILPPSSLETYSHLSFESLNCPAFHILPSAIAAVFGVGASTGLNVHIGYDATDITVVNDSVVCPEAHVRIETGTRDCILYLQDILSKDQAVMDSLRSVCTATGVAGSDELEQLKTLAEELATVILQEEKPRLVVPLANGQTVPVGDDETDQTEDGVFNVAKEWVTAYFFFPLEPVHLTPTPLLVSNS